MRRFNDFCRRYDVHTPFPVTENLLTYFAAFLAGEGLKAQSIKTYLAAVRHLQLTLGLPDPRDSSSLPRLRLVLLGIRRMQAESGRSQTRKRLPMTPAILRRIRRLWNERATRGEYIMPWAALTLCFFGFFRSGELTVPTGKSFDASIHLSWGDVAINDPRNPRAIKVRLRRSKTDQFRNGVDVIVGRTGDDLCPVAAVAAFMAKRGEHFGAILQIPRRFTAHEGKVHRILERRSWGARASGRSVRRPQLKNRGSHDGSPGWVRGLDDYDVGTVE